MNDEVREILMGLIRQYGRDLCEDPRRTEALLRDLCGTYKREINVLVGAARERVPADLLASSGTNPKELLVSRLTQRLQDNLAFTEEAAQWAVVSWAISLGVITSPLALAPSPARPSSVASTVSTPRLSTPAVSVSPRLGEEWINPIDGSVLVWIPGGEFLMGSPDGQGYGDEHPQHRVEPFYLSKYEVTNAQWKKFVDANTEWRKDQIKREYHNGDYLKHWNGNYPPAGKENHPVVYVSWYAAWAYCEWAGLRLATEAEWEYAAQGGKGYAYGTATGKLSRELANYGWLWGIIGGTTEVGKYPANPFEIHDLCGNVWEWCSSEYRPYPYRADDGREDLKANVRRVVRGGSWLFYYNSFTRAQNLYHTSPIFTHFDVGLRCARDPRP